MFNLHAKGLCIPHYICVVSLNLQVLPYDELMQELDVTNVRELEDFLINECMYAVCFLLCCMILYINFSLTNGSGCVHNVKGKK